MAGERRILAWAMAALIGTSGVAFAQDATPAAGSGTTPAAAAGASGTAAAPAAPATPAAPAAAGTAPAPAAAAAPTAPPPPAVPDVVQAWAKFCDPDAKGTKICIVRKLAFANTSIIGSLVLRIDPTKGVPILAVAAVPVGVLLKPGLKWQIDKQKPVIVPYWRCTAQSCESEQLVKPDFIKALRNGKVLAVTAKNVEGKDFVVSMPLSGFSAVYDNPNPPTYAQYQASLPK